MRATDTKVWWTGTRPEGILPGKGESSMQSSSLRNLVSVVDDDESIRESLPDLLAQFGYTVQAFQSAQEFLASGSVGQTRCLILDVAMPGMTGPDLQRELARLGESIAIVFITAHSDENTRTRVMAEGAVDYLMKPFSETELLGALDAGFRKP